MAFFMDVPGVCLARRAGLVAQSWAQGSLWFDFKKIYHPSLVGDGSIDRNSISSAITVSALVTSIPVAVIMLRAVSTKGRDLHMVRGLEMAEMDFLDWSQMVPEFHIFFAIFWQISNRLTMSFLDWLWSVVLLWKAYHLYWIYIWNSIHERFLDDILSNWIQLFHKRTV